MTRPAAAQTMRRMFGSAHAPRTPEERLAERRERVFLVLAGFFLGSLAMLNIIGLTRFIQIGPLALAVGVLPYPLTFLCTDFISEFYGRRRANFVVWVGLALNGFVLFILWLGHVLPGAAETAQLPWQHITFTEPVRLLDGTIMAEGPLFDIIYHATRGAVFASMIAYIAAQFCDVALYHFWKKLTKGRHLWLRNNGSTMVSQLVDSSAVILITFGAAFHAGDMTARAMLVLIASSYAFKVVVALLDTIPLYIGVHYLSGYLKIDPRAEYGLEPEPNRTESADGQT